MSNQTEKIYMQTIVVTSGPASGFEMVAGSEEESHPTYQITQFGPSSAVLEADTPGDSIITSMFSSIPVVGHEQLSSEYRELGEALSSLTELDEESEWKIERPVFEAARSVALQLMHSSLPTPRVLSHGSKSVVFNWSDSGNNLYLTVSADRISALISSPERIKRRMEIDYAGLPDTIHILLASVEDDEERQPIVLFVTQDISDTSRILD